jgi:coenzyme F420-0:L-glutamate ligase
MPRVAPGQNLTTLVLNTIKSKRLQLNDGDVVAVASKVVSTCEGRIVALGQVRVTQTARRIANRWEMDERLARLVLDEAEAIFGGVRGFLLTIKNGILTANAGIDLKNSPLGTASLWPERPDASARALRRSLELNYNARLGIELVDSRVTPLRLGTTGLALGLSGFVPILDYRGKPDLYGRRVRITRTNIADDIAASAHLLIGESNERVGAVIVRNAPIVLSESANSRQVRLDNRRCLITNSLASAHRFKYS